MNVPGPAMNPPLSADICVQILARLENLEDKLAFASSCHSALEASRDHRAWSICDIANVSKQHGESGHQPSAADPLDHHYTVP